MRTRNTVWEWVGFSRMCDLAVRLRFLGCEP